MEPKRSPNDAKVGSKIAPKSMKIDLWASRAREALGYPRGAPDAKMALEFTKNVRFYHAIKKYG